LEIPKRVKSDITKIMHSSSSKMTPLVFQTAGAWVFNRIARSWMREVNSMILWADHDFDNNSPEAKEMDALFDMSVISGNSLLAGENLDLVPHPDDVLGNPKLFESFAKFIPSTELTTKLLQLIKGCHELLASPPEVQPSKCGPLLELLKGIAKELPDVKDLCDEIVSHYEKEKEAFNPFAFSIPSFLASKFLLHKFYTPWVAKCKSVYEKGGWVPVKHLLLVSNDAVPGTSWIPSVGLSNEPSESPSVPTASAPKKKWSFMNKLRGNVSSDSPVSSSSGSSKHSRHSSASSTHSPVSGLVVSQAAKEDPAKSQRDSPSSSEEEMLVDSGVSPTSPLCSDGQKSSRAFRLPSGVPKSVPLFRLEIPSLSDTLTSAHLRRLFFSTFLELRLGDDEKKLWTALSKFQSDFAALTDAEVAQRQKDIRDAAMKVLSENAQIPDHDALVKIIKDSKYNISSKFFLDAEVKLYQNFHNYFQSFLANNQWVKC